MTRVQPRNPSLDQTPGVVVVGAGKGGVGTSVVSALLALAAAGHGMSALLVDANEPVGSQPFLFGLANPGPGMGRLRFGQGQPADLVHAIRPGLSLLTTGSTEGPPIRSGERRALLRHISSLFPSYDLVVVDSGSRVDSVLASCATGAERLICVTAPERISIAASYALFKLVRQSLGDLSIEVLVNGTDERNARMVLDTVQSAARNFLGTEVGAGGSLPSDASLAQLVASGESLVALDPSSPALEAAATYLDRLMAAAAQTPQARVLPFRSA